MVRKDGRYVVWRWWWRSTISCFTGSCWLSTLLGKLLYALLRDLENRTVIPQRTSCASRIRGGHMIRERYGEVQSHRGRSESVLLCFLVSKEHGTTQDTPNTLRPYSHRYMRSSAVGPAVNQSLERAPAQICSSTPTTSVFSRAGEDRSFWR